jgi:hypothetical protein
MAAVTDKEYESFAEFYPAYLSIHSNRLSRELHFAGSTLAIISLIALLLTGNLWWLLAAVLFGFIFAWVGHLLYEKGEPSSLHHPLYSFMGNWVMYWQMLTGQTSF